MFSTVEFRNSLELEKTHVMSGRLAYRLMCVDTVILDEMGLLPFTQSGGALLFHLLSKFCAQTFVIATMNFCLSQ